MTTTTSLYAYAAAIAPAVIAPALAAHEPTPRAAPLLAAVDAFPNHRFEFPADLQVAPDGSNRIFVVVQKKGVIRVFRNEPDPGPPTTYLDIFDRIDTSGVESGILALAFHPDYANNGHAFVTYTTHDGDMWHCIVSRFTVSSGNPDRLNVFSELVLLDVPQDQPDHNVHRLAFGPDGYLYIAAGDGGSPGSDAENDAQNPATLKGSILRIDVDNADPPLNYAIPPTNPFAGNELGYREEVFAYGVRNPWRIVFSPDAKLWVGDVGDASREELGWATAGDNLGWKFAEGFRCNISPDCLDESLTPPLLDYNHEFSAEGGFAITAGQVYADPSCPALFGAFIYADFITGNFWALHYNDDGPTANTNVLPLSGVRPTAFARTQDGELLVTDYTTVGRILRLEPINLCPADFAPPLNSLDFSDVIAFLTAFAAALPTADLAPPKSQFDFSDIVAFLGHFADGCP